MAKVDVLVPFSLGDYVMDRLDAEFTVHRLWEAADPKALLQDKADVIRAAATTHTPVFDRAMIDGLPNLEVISNFGVGYDSVDAAYAATKGIKVTNTPGVLSDEVADTAIGLMIMTVRELGAAERYLRAGRWDKEGAYPLTRGTLAGKTLGILGLGRIGKAIASRAEALGLKVAYFGRRRQSGVEYTFYSDLMAMARDSDILLSILPGGSATQHLLNAEVFEALGSDGYVLNIGRGNAIDEQALISALKGGTIAGAGLDVFEKEPHVPQELMTMEQVVLLPHVGSASVHTRNQMGQLVVDNLTSWFASGKVISPVPECA